MTRYDDDLISRWLAEGPQHGSAEAIDGLVARVTASAQRPGWIVTLTGGTMGTAFGGSALRYAAFALMLVALVTLLLGGMIAGGMLTPEPRRAVVVEESHRPLASATASSPAADPSPRDDPTPYPSATHVEADGDVKPAVGKLNPGTYTEVLDGTGLNLRFTVPAGWEWGDEDLSLGTPLSGGARITFSVGRLGVYEDACHWTAGTSKYRGTVAAVMAALADQRAWSATPIEDRPANGLFDTDRWYGQVIELAVPPSLDRNACDDGQLRAWHHPDRWWLSFGPVEDVMVWGIGEDGIPLVTITGVSYSGTSAQVLSEMEAILDSIILGHWG